MTKLYTGIGSRKTPRDIQGLMHLLAVKLASEGWTLRSGHAEGADQAFESGAGEACEIYLPWLGFNAHIPIQGQLLAAPTLEAHALAEHYHPAWSRLSQGAKKLHARNCHQVLGHGLNSRSSFLVCWTPDGQDSGGTGQALRLARDSQIPIFNLFNQADRDRMQKYVSPASGPAPEGSGVSPSGRKIEISPRQEVLL